MTPERADEIYAVCLQTSLELEADPTILGPRYINDVVSKCRNYLNKIVMILLEIQREKRTLARRHAGAETSFKVEADNLLASDDRVRGLPNIKDREAFINYLLADRRKEISDLELELLDLDTIEKTVRLRHQELVRTSDNIKTQRSLLLTDRVTGAGYGDETERRDAKGRVLPPDEEGVNEGEIDRILATQFPSTVDPSQRLPEPAQTPEEPTKAAAPVEAVEETASEPIEPEQAQSPTPEVEEEEPVIVEEPVVIATVTVSEVVEEAAPAEFTPAAIPDDLDDLLAMIPDSPEAAQVPATSTPDPTPIKEEEPVVEAKPEEAKSEATMDEALDFLASPGPEVAAAKTASGKAKSTSKPAPKAAKKAEETTDDFDFSAILNSM